MLCRLTISLLCNKTAVTVGDRILREAILGDKINLQYVKIIFNDCPFSYPSTHIMHSKRLVQEKTVCFTSSMDKVQAVPPIQLEETTNWICLVPK